jgi:phage shock protein A
MTRSGGGFKRLLRGAFDGLLAPAPDPRAIFAEPSARHRTLLDQARAAAGRLAETRARLEARRDETRQWTTALEERARQALAAGDATSARAALERAAPAAAALAQLDREISALREDEARLAAVVSRSSAQLELLAAREQLAATRHSVAQARVAVGEALSGLDEPAGLPPIERIERETVRLQARAEAIEELLGDNFFGAAQRAFAQPSGADDHAAIDAQLAALARELDERASHDDSPRGAEGA